MLRLNTSIKPTAKPNRLGVLGGDLQGYPNGRRLADDTVDITLQAAEGAVSVNANGEPTGVSIVKPLAAGDAVDTNDVAFGSAFPYLALPHSGSGEAVGARPSGGMDAGGGGTAGADTSGRGGLALPLSAALLGLGFAGAAGVLLLRTRTQAIR